MRLSELLLGTARPTRVAAVYWNRETAVAAVEAARRNGEARDVRLVGPLEQVLGEPSAAVRGAWAVVVQPSTYEQCRRIVRALRRPWRSRRVDAAEQRVRAVAAGS